MSTFNGIRLRWSTDVIARRAALVDELKKMFGTEVLTPYALRFLYSYPQITAVIPGIKSIKQLEELLEIPQSPLPNKQKKALEAFYDDKLKNNPLPW